ncbi:MAG: hypothetical protein ABIE23_05755 [archaeon]
MKLKDFTGKACNSRTAFEFIPKKKNKLDLSEIAEKLKEKEVFIEIETPFLLILRMGGKTLSFFKSGKILVKETPIEEDAKKIAEELMSKLEET